LDWGVISGSWAHAAKHKANTTPLKGRSRGRLELFIVIFLAGRVDL
jgi:hypothetical protein